MSRPPRATPTDAELADAARLLQRGGVVAFPTETVYGLGADATNPVAVARIFEIKNRPRFDPLIVHVESTIAARALAAHWPDYAARLAERFWPGPLTLVMPRRHELIPDIVTAGLPTVALRVPAHPVALDLIRRSGVPIAAPSANRFGSVSPTTAAHVRESLGEAVDLILDGGSATCGVESTIISLAGARPALLRSGALPIEAIEEWIGPVERLDAKESRDAMGSNGARPRAPGMLDRHYATATPLHLRGNDPAGLVASRCGRLCFTTPDDAEVWRAVEVLSPSGDLREAAVGLFAAMRRLDALGLDAIIADRFPQHGLGLAINDRLRRAARQ